MLLQQAYGKEYSKSEEEWEAIDPAGVKGLVRFSRLVCVVSAANRLVAGGEKIGGHYYRVSVQCFKLRSCVTRGKFLIDLPTIVLSQ